MAERAAIAIAAHPDDIEFTMAGTLLRLREAGWEIHCLNVSSGDCGSLVHGRAALRRAGFSDRDIWDIIAVTAFFNMTNRLAAATDMMPNEEYLAASR